MKPGPAGYSAGTATITFSMRTVMAPFAEIEGGGPARGMKFCAPGYLASSPISRDRSGPLRVE